MVREFRPPTVKYLKQICMYYELEFRGYVFNPFKYCPDITEKKIKYIRIIVGDGHCGFRALSLAITGGQEQHGKIRKILMEYILQQDELKMYHEYALKKLMVNSKQSTNNQDHWMWGIDLLVAAHIFELNIYVKEANGWELYNSDGFLKSNMEQAQHIKEYPTILIRNENNEHYDLVDELL